MKALSLFFAYVFVAITVANETLNARQCKQQPIQRNQIIRFLSYKMLAAPCFMGDAQFYAH